MNSPSHRLDTVKPGLVNVDRTDAAPTPPPQQAPPPLPPPKKEKRQGGFFQIAEFQHSNFWTWANRFASGWVFSLLLHFLLLILLGSVVTQWTVEGSLPLTVTMSEAEVVETLTIDISPLDLESELGETEPLEPTHLDEMQVEEVPTEVTLVPELEPIDNESILPNAMSDADMLSGVAMGGKGKGAGKGGGGKGGKGNVKFFGVESSGNQFIFVIDCSGSMSNENRYQRAVYELGRSISMLQKDNDFLVILYNTETYPMLGMNAATMQMVPATDTNKALVMEWLSKQSPSSQTRPKTAMQVSLALRPSTIFLLSDGDFNDDTVAMLEQTNVEDKSTGLTQIPINTISLGNSGSGAPTMRGIAEDNGGRFYWARTLPSPRRSSYRQLRRPNNVDRER